MLTETEFEMLEGYLDGALEAGEMSLVRARLAGDGEWIAAAEQLRAERSMRAAIFAGLEPDDRAVEAMVARIGRDVRRRRLVGMFGRPMRYAAAAAVFLAIGFFSRGIFDRPGAALTDSTPGNKTGVEVKPIPGYQVTLRDEAGRVVAVQKFDSLEKAQEFAADLARWQSGSEKLASGRFVLSADRF